jgi:membrane fusion protein, heavy metal efflux system
MRDLTLGIAVLLAFVCAGCTGGETQDAAPATSAEQASGTEPAVANETAAAEVSDLDRSVADLMQAACEHGIAQYTCDECRYEVGMVKVERELLGGDGPLDTLVVSRRPVSQSIELTGEVELDATRSVYVGPRASGIVRSIRVDLGSRVRSGQVLFEIEAPDFARAKADFGRARAAAVFARATREREAELFERKICPQKDLLEAQAALDAALADERAAREQLLGLGLEAADIDELARVDSASASRLLPVRAPFDGTILERSLNLGAAVEPGQPLMLLGETDRMWVITSVYERELALLIERQAREQLVAEIEVPAYPGRRFTGEVDRLQGTLDSATRTARVRILVDNPGDLLRAGMFARVHLLLPGEEDVFAVPPEAVLSDEGRDFVFIRALPPYFVRRPVASGRAWPGWVEITEGLTGGETLVTRGGFLLKSDVLRSKMGAGCAD